MEERRTSSTARLIGRNVALRPIATQDYDLLYMAEHSDQLGPRWRLQGNTISPETYPQILWQGVTAQFAVVEAGQPRPVGIVCLYNANHADQFAYFSVADLGVGGSPTRVSRGAVLFIAYVFKTWPFRKLYVQAMDYNLDQYSSMCGRVLQEEGRLRDHHFLEGRYWDEVTLAIYRDVWDRWEAKVLRGVLPAENGRAA